MNGNDIERKLKAIFQLAKHRARDVTFLGVFPKDRLPARIPSNPSLLVANTDDHNKPGEHWIAIYFNPYNQHAEYFDSFGEPPLAEFQTYMLMHAKRVAFNERQIQSVMSAFCGHYVVLFCVHRSIGYDVNKFVGLFTSDYCFNDFLAHRMVCFVLPK